MTSFSRVPAASTLSSTKDFLSLTYLAPESVGFSCSLMTAISRPSSSCSSPAFFPSHSCFLTLEVEVLVRGASEG